MQLHSALNSVCIATPTGNILETADAWRTAAVSVHGVHIRGVSVHGVHIKGVVLYSSCRYHFTWVGLTKSHPHGSWNNAHHVTSSRSVLVTLLLFKNSLNLSLCWFHGPSNLSGLALVKISVIHPLTCPSSSSFSMATCLHHFPYYF